MEIKISISDKISIQDDQVNINEIVYEADRFGNLLKKVIAERIIEHYQEAVVNRMCETEEELNIEHLRKGTEDEICKGKRYTKEGYRRQERKIKTDFGEIGFKVRNVECKECGRILAPIPKDFENSYPRKEDKGTYHEDS